MSHGKDPAAQFGTRIDEIADAIGISTEELYAATAPPIVREALVLLNVYSKIGGTQARKRVLSTARRELARSQPNN